MSEIKKQGGRKIESGHDAVLAVLSSAEPGVKFDPMYVQGILYIFTRESNAVGSKVFSFENLDYIPTDQKIYDLLDKLADENFLEMQPEGEFWDYVVNDEGFERGKEIVNQLARETQNYLKKLVNWALNCNLGELTSAIYRK